MITLEGFDKEYNVIVQSNGDCLTEEYVEMFKQNTAQVRVLFGGPLDGEDHIIPETPAHTIRVDFITDATWNGETAKYAVYEWDEKNKRYAFKEVIEQINEGQKYYF